MSSAIPIHGTGAASYGAGLQACQRPPGSPKGLRYFLKMFASVSFVSFVLIPPQAFAQMATAPGAAGYKQETRMPSSALPEPLRSIGFDQNIDQHVPLDTVFRDESGASVRLGDYFGRRPVVLVFAYFDCPMLCTQVINGLSSALGVLSLVPGKDFEIVTVSFNPRDTPASAAAKKAVYLERYKQPGAAESWHFLTGDEPSIERLTQAAGFRYAWDADTKQFAHPSGIIVLTPDGRLARYLFGIEYGPRDLRYAIIDASAGKVGTPVDSLLLYCYHYDPMTGRYGLVIMRVMRLAGAATVLALGAFIVIMLRRERARGSTGSPPASDPATLVRSVRLPTSAPAVVGGATAGRQPDRDGPPKGGHYLRDGRGSR